MEDSKKFRGTVVKKSNVINEGIYTLDTVEKYKLFYLMIAQIAMQDKAPQFPRDISNREYSFYIDDYAEMKEIKNKYSFENFVAQIIDYLEKNTAITIKGENFVETIWVFDKVRFENDTKGLKITYRFSYSISQYLFELKDRFMRYHIRNIMPMKSKYSIRLYEILKQYENVGERTFDIEEFREMIGTRVYIVDKKTGEEKLLSDDYKEFKELKRRVIEKAVEEVNRVSDIEITKVEYKKKGKNVKYITFYFQPKQLNVLKESAEDIINTGQTQRNVKQLPPYVEAVWQNIRELRKFYKPQIEEILNFIDSIPKHRVKYNHLSENQILFLLINANRNLFNDALIVDIIKNAIINKNIDNAMGFLIKTLHIDIENAKFKELTLTDKKIDKELLKRTLEDRFIDGKPATKYMAFYWDNYVKVEYEKGELSKEDLDLLKPILKSAVYDEIDNAIYIPLPDNLFKIWFESEFLDSIKNFMFQNFNIADVILVVSEKKNSSWLLVIENVLWHIYIKTEICYTVIYYE